MATAPPRLANCDLAGLTRERAMVRLILLLLIATALADPDPYAVLGLRRDASASDVKKRFRTLAKQWHPDKHTGAQ